MNVKTTVIGEYRFMLLIKSIINVNMAGLTNLIDLWFGSGMNVPQNTTHKKHSHNVAINSISQFIEIIFYRPIIS